MLFFFGTRSTQIEAQKTAICCQHCQEDNYWLHIYQHYFHLFWIPVFPLWKQTVSACAHCKQVLAKREFLPEMLDEYKTIRQKAKAPWWTYFLLILFVLLLLTAICLSKFSGS